MFKIDKRLKESQVKPSKVKIKGIKEFKSFLRVYPANAPFGVFGVDSMIKNKSKAIVITEGEYDAMSVYQVTKLPSVSLPFGASNFPFQLINYLSSYE